MMTNKFTPDTELDLVKFGKVVGTVIVVADEGNRITVVDKATTSEQQVFAYMRGIWRLLTNTNQVDPSSPQYMLRRKEEAA